MLATIDNGLSGQDSRIAVPPRLLHRAFDPFDSREIDAEIALQHAAYPDGGGHGVELDADALAREILRRLDDAGIDGDEAVPEHARGKDRQGDERALPTRESGHVFRGRHLRGVEFQPGDSSSHRCGARPPGRPLGTYSS